MAGDDLKADPQVKAYIKKREKLEAAEEKRTKQIGKFYTDFELNSLDGETKLSDYVGKSELLLIDFWASWCAPCIAEIPHLKSLFQQYEAQGLTIISISIDHNETAWKKSLEKQDMPWNQLIIKKGDEKRIMEMYNFQGIPYLLLLDKEGKIIESDLRGPRLDFFIRESLK